MARLAIPASRVVVETPALVVIRLAKALDLAETRVVIGLSYKPILRRQLTFIDTWTNSLVAGLVAREGLPPFIIYQRAANVLFIVAQITLKQVVQLGQDFAEECLFLVLY